jgi:S-methylmethionine-dependent homocysteine/selenocysteine methylase
MARRRRRAPRRTRTRTVYVQAPRRRRRTVARRRTARRYVRRARSFGGGQKQIVDGLLGGVGASLGSKYLGSYGAGAGYLAVGYFRNNNTLKTLGAVQLGQQIAGMIPMIGGGATNGGLFEG